jgi:putative ABC transport system permease protein
MLIWEGMRLAVASIATHKLRTFLTLLANIVAVSSVIAVVSILEGMDLYVKQKVADQGSGILTVQRTDPLKILQSLDDFIASLRNPDLTLDDAAYLRANLQRAELVGASLRTAGRVAYRERWLDGIGIRGFSPEYPLLRDWSLAAGRHFTELEVERKSAVAVIGSEVAQNLFPGQDPIDKSIKIGRRPFHVIGVFQEQGTILGNNQDRFVCVPITTYQKIYGTEQSIDILVKVADLGSLDAARDEITSWMRIRHRLRPTDRDDFEVSSAELLVSLWEGISRSIFLALGGIASISLVIGGIIIMNIMLVSVTERTREIGIRKALGARRGAILWQILVESTTLSGTGGLLGMTAGFVIASLVSAFSPLPYTIQPWAIVAGMVVTLGTGVFFGIYPASKAARLDPIEALRYE